jgi:hypothetical protein
MSSGNRLVMLAIGRPPWQWHALPLLAALRSKSTCPICTAVNPHSHRSRTLRERERERERERV